MFPLRQIWLMEAFSNGFVPNSCTAASKIAVRLKSAFSFCRELRVLNLSEGLEEIDIMAFWGCDKLESLSIPSTVKTIGASAFAECTSLRSVTIPRIFEDQIDEIFAGCNDLEITYID